MADISQLVFIKAGPDKIFEALSTQNGIAGWWSTYNDARPLVGSEFRISFGGEYFKNIRVTALNAPFRVTWEILNAHPEWMNTSISFDIGIGETCSELRFIHSGWKECSDMYAQCNHHWAIYLENLKIYCERGKRLALSEYF